MQKKIYKNLKLVQVINYFCHSAFILISTIIIIIILYIITNDSWNYLKNKIGFIVDTHTWIAILIYFVRDNYYQL